MSSKIAPFDRVHRPTSFYSPLQRFYCATLCCRYVSIRLSVRHMPVIPKQLNVGSRKQSHRIAQRFYSFLKSKILAKFDQGHPTGAPDRGEVVSNWQLTSRYISETVEDREGYSYYGTLISNSYALYRMALFLVTFSDP